MGEFDKFGNSVGSTTKDKGERHHCNQVKDEPGLEIIARDLAAGTDQHFLPIEVGREESEHNVSQEDQVNQDFSQHPGEMAMLRLEEGCL